MAAGGGGEAGRAAETELACGSGSLALGTELVKVRAEEASQ